MQKSNRKIIKRAESPVINSVGQRPAGECVDRIGRCPTRCSKINLIINH